MMNGGEDKMKEGLEGLDNEKRKEEISIVSESSYICRRRLKDSSHPAFPTDSTAASSLLSPCCLE